MSDAREAEATGQPASFEFRGEAFTVSRDRDEWTLDFLESLEEGKSVGIIRGALGPAQWRIVKSMGIKVKDANELSDLIAKAMGFADVGESEASST
jgi:hypothetical protein